MTFRKSEGDMPKVSEMTPKCDRCGVRMTSRGASQVSIKVLDEEGGECVEAWCPSCVLRVMFKTAQRSSVR